MTDAPSAEDLAAIARQLGREPRGVRRVAHRCSCGDPDVVETEPRLPDGTPFPTLYYLTCPRAAGLIGTLEAGGTMRDMQDRLADDPGLGAGETPAPHGEIAAGGGRAPRAEVARITAGGMPSRVKCLHVLVGHALAAGPGVNPFGDEALDLLPDWGAAGPCTRDESA